MAPLSDKDIACKVKSEFARGNYASCLELLGKLSVKDDDVKLMHNKAVVQFYMSGTTQVDTFQKALKELFEKARLRPEGLSTLEHVASCVLYYNHAVLLYHHRQYRAALAIISKVFKYIESLDDSTSKRIGLLLVECYLCCHQPTAALSAIKVIEVKFLSKPEDVKRKDGSPTGLYVRVQRCKCRALLQTHNTLELTPLLQTLPGPSVYQSFLQSYSLYLSGRCADALAVLNNTVHRGDTVDAKLSGVSDTGEHQATMYHNNLACINHYMNKPNTAAFHLQAALNENQAAAAELNGGRGRQDEPARCSSSSPAGGKALHTTGSSRHHELLYNMGIVLLHAGQPRRAFDCLVESLQVFTTNPRLWLRVAECCIMVHRHECYGRDKDEFSAVNLVEQRVGSGPHRKLILRTTDSNCSRDETSAAIPNPTMQFAGLALRNAWLILGEDGEGECPVNVEPANPVTADQVQSIRCAVLAALSYVHLCLHEPLLALQRAEQLGRQRHVSPALSLLARSYSAEALLMMDRGEQALAQLTTQMAAVSDGDSRHRPLLLTHDTTDTGECGALEGVSPVLQRWRPATVSAARLCVQYNMAVVFTRRHMLDKAWELLKTMNPATADVPALVVRLAIYIQLKHGHLDMVRSIMKQHAIRTL